LIDQVPVRVIADCFKYGNKIGLDVAIEALRTYRERTRKPNYQALSRFAQAGRVETVMRPYLEAVLCAHFYVAHPAVRGGLSQRETRLHSG
jgi:hypothetical protein